jgi:Zn-dependent protease with chaperone function
MFTTIDGIATVGLMAVVVALLVMASVRESMRVVETRRRLVGVAHPMPLGAFPVPLKALSSQLGVKPPQVFILELDRPVAAVAGVARPVLFISRWMLDHLSSEELETLVAHEIAHLKHADNLIAWLDVILLRAFAFIPPVRRAWEESLAEREEAADARAAQLTRRPLDLAAALVKVAEQGSGPHELLHGASSFSGDSRLLERRVERLLAPLAADARPWGWPAIGAAVTAGTLPFLTAWVLGFATSCLNH